MIARTYSTRTIPELTDSQIEDIFVALDRQFNEVILSALTRGIHTGVVAVTLWTVASRNNSQNYRLPHFLIVIILLLYLLTVFNLYYEWAMVNSYFGVTGESFAEAFQSYHIGIPILLTIGIDAILSAVLADAALIWRCWIVWGRSWRVVLVPIVCTTLAIASRGIVAYYSAFGPIENISPRALYLENIVNWAVLYSSLIMATLLWCTILIIYRILSVGGAAGRMRVYQRLIEMLVESALLYSAVIVVLLVFEVRNETSGAYVEEVAIAIRAIAPTILVGRVAAGHARPDDSWSGSTTASSLRFRGHSSSQNDNQVDAGSEWDISSRAALDLEEGLLEGSAHN
ncbi:hypothetical protein ARMGADRAFT_1111903 [Armillaria gallica]|uniref:Uncharacterized protein n=1 Tax=Armillaria gallica TaxID=47427 RepID=A0A2H3D9T3_ARMGA|nr:hypothetical protein ARMGADRAFT_1111903 [Armillaria gallica]